MSIIVNARATACGRFCCHGDPTPSTRRRGPVIRPAKVLIVVISALMWERAAPIDEVVEVSDAPSLNV